MIEYLHLENVGPSPELTMDFGPRLNLITGDNGLGKSFLLDIAWWALTRSWPAVVNPSIASGSMARPARSGRASIEFSFRSKSKKESYRSEFDRREETWTEKPGRPANPGLVLYAQVDGGFSVWDPARNARMEAKKGDAEERQPAYVFSSQQVWHGLKRGDTQLCNGLVLDWALWQKEGGEAFRQLSEVLASLSPSPEEKLEPGSLGKLSIADSRWIPTLKTPYGLDVPVLRASAALKRVAALAYLVVWAWQEHVRNVPLLDEAPTRQITFLIDELEGHLHPRWQRTIVRSLLQVMRGLAGEASIQIVAVTHSPLLLASVEPLFDAATDAWFDLDLEPKGELPTDQVKEVKLTRRDFVRHGDVSNWLTSEAFDLGSARSLEAEIAIADARALLQLQDQAPIEDIERVDLALRAVLGDIDPFWVRWSAYVERRREGR